MRDTNGVKCAFLYNPNSGKGKIAAKRKFIEGRLRALYGEVAAEETGSAAEMTARAAFWAERCDVLVFAGGDGTVNAVLQGVAGRDVTLGYLPAGTVNDAAGSLGIPKGLRGALDVLARGKTMQADCLKMGKRYAFCIVAAGSVTRLTYDTPQRNKRRFGWFAYAAEFAKRIFRETPFHAEIDCGGARIEGDFALALILNGKKVARFSVNRGASMRDGLCEVALVRHAGGARERWGARIAILRLLLFGMRGGGKRVVRLRGREVGVRKTNSVLWDFDGERGTEGDIEARVLPGAVRIFVP